jgi:N-acetylglutamate synthase-like GNAT family acetyltransferase
MTASIDSRYPHRLVVKDGEIELRRMKQGDAEAILSFARALPAHDLLFMRRNICEPKVVAAWIKDAVAGDLMTVLAIQDSAIVGCLAVIQDKLSWSPHVGELRLVVADRMRGRGLGRALTQEAFAIALGLGLEKLMAFMTVDQHGAIAIFEGLGFRAEAVLGEHVKDSNNTKHDVVVLGCDIAKYLGRLQTFGMGAPT